MPKRTKNVVRWLAYGCAHAPLHDPDAIDWLCEQVEEFRPDYIISLGDDLEADGASRWPSEEGFDLLDEYAADDEIKRQIMDAGGRRCEYVRCMGNHDHNILDWGRVDPKLRRLCDWRQPQHTLDGAQVNKNALKWKLATTYDFCRRRGVFRLGQVTLGHGWRTGAKADAEHSVLLGAPYGLWVGVHTHRPQHVNQAMMTSKVPIPYWFANAGTMRNLDPNYMTRHDKTMWGQAVVVGDADLRAGPAKSLRVSRQWNAETRVRGLYNDWIEKRTGSGVVTA